tara:strand:- start:8919 stop:9848 length:930 start_codon:yes stop_codon:yes gene_type:complete
MRTLIADSQALNLVSLCPRRYFFQQVISLEPTKKSTEIVTETEGSYLEKGDLLHTFLRIYYKLKMRELPHPDCVALSLEYGRGHAVELFGVPIHVCEYIASQFAAYAKYYRHDSWKPIAVEQAFSKVMYESESDDLRIIYEGIVDLLVMAEGIDRPVPVDHKSSKRRSDPKKMGVNQFKGYCWASGSTRFFVNKVGFQKTLSPKERFQRDPLHWNALQLEEWRIDAVYWLKELANHLSQDSWPTNETACSVYFRECDFAKICGVSPKVRGFKMFADFQIHERWDPKKAAAEHLEEEEWLNQRVGNVVAV